MYFLENIIKRRALMKTYYWILKIILRTPAHRPSVSFHFLQLYPSLTPTFDVCFSCNSPPCPSKCGGPA